MSKTIHHINIKPGMLIINELRSMTDVAIMIVLTTDGLKTKYIRLNSDKGLVIETVNTSYLSTWLYKRAIKEKNVYIYE